MSENTEKLLAEVIDIVRTSKTFVLSEAPDLARQIILKGRILETIWLIAILVAIYYVIQWGKIIVRDKWDSFAWLPLGLVSIVLMISLGCVSSSAFSVWLAPKLYLLNELRGSCGK